LIAVPEIVDAVFQPEKPIRGEPVESGKFRYFNSFEFFDLTRSKPFAWCVPNFDPGFSVLGRGFFLFRTGEYHQMPNQIDLRNTRG
jgi:hypothetical protein